MLNLLLLKYTRLNFALMAVLFIGYRLVVEAAHREVPQPILRKPLRQPPPVSWHLVHMKYRARLQ